jgi:membrane protein
MGKLKGWINQLFRLLKAGYAELMANDPLRMAAATAFFTTFALPPILIIVVQVFKLIFKMENLSDQFFERIAGVLGTESSSTIKSTFAGFLSKAQNWWITILGFVFLMFVATTLFKVIRDSLNQLWDIQPDLQKKVRVGLEKRAVGLLVIFLAAILFIASTALEGLGVLTGIYLDEILPGTGYVVNIILQYTLSILIVTTWFTLLFKLLPNANPSWKVVMVGGFFTGILFSIGKIIIPKLLPFAELSSIFGTSSSVVLLLLFVFYSSFILYYGACFTKVYAIAIHQPIKGGQHGHLFDAKKVEAIKDKEMGRG